MKDIKRFIPWMALGIVAIILIVFLVTRPHGPDGTAGSGGDPSKSGTNGAEASGKSTQTATLTGLASDWVPYQVDDSPADARTPYSLALGGGLDSIGFTASLATPAPTNAAGQALSDKELQVQTLLQKMPHYPIKDIPILQPDMVMQSSEKQVEDTLQIDLMYTSKMPFQEALDACMKQMGGYQEFSDTTVDSKDGQAHNLYFKLPGEADVHGSVLVSPMPADSGYSSMFMISVSYRNLAPEQKAVVDVGKDAEGIPNRYPKDLLPLFNLKELYEADVDDDSISIQFYTGASLKDTLDFYRKTLEDKPGFSETANDGEAGAYFVARPLHWEVNLRITEMDGTVYVEINLYDQKTEGQ